MHKKGQITGYIIVGIILLATLIFFFAFQSSTQSESTQQEAIQQLGVNPTSAAKTLVESCIRESLENRIPQMAQRGGMLTPDLSRVYYSNEYTYWCVQSNDFGCVNRVISRNEMENTLARQITEDVLSCITWESFDNAGFEVQTQTPSTIVTIAPNNINALLTYPVTLSGEGEELSIQEFSTSMDTEFGTLYELATRILFDELTLQFFDKDTWMNEHTVDYKIHRHRPYPDILYDIEKYDPATKQTLHFRFALEGRDTADELGLRFKPEELPGCRLPDGVVHVQVRPEVCLAKNGNQLTTIPTQWSGVASFDQRLPSEDATDCGFYQDGESWCEYQTPTGNGFDYVGARHIVKSCHNGEILVETCRDYREEICTQTTTQPSQAVCRTNRWHDCALQNSQSTCADTTLRDCVWQDELLGTTVGNPSYGKQFGTQLCSPQVPPGFKHWQSGYAEDLVCALGNEGRNCDGFNCPQNWIDTSAIYCHSLGDCGNYRNINNDITYEGFYSTDPQSNAPRNYIYLSNTAINQRHTLTLPLNIPEFESEYFSFESQRTSPTAIINGFKAWKGEAESWDKCDICECIKILGEEIPVPECNFKKYFHAANICEVWQAPENTAACGSCGDSDFPCTEYWCKSIGSCYFAINEDGVGICSSSGPALPPLEILSIEASDDILVEDKDLITFRGESYQVHQLTPDIQPYQLIELEIELNNPAYCEVEDLLLSFLPSYKYYKSTTPKTTHTVLLQATPFQRYLEPTMDTLGIDSLADAAVPAKVDDFIQELLEVEVPQELASSYANLEGVSQEVEERIRDLQSAVTEHVLDTVEHLATLQLTCQDQVGNSIEPLLFQYRILEDSFPPTLTQYNAPNGNNDQFSIQLNEPVECKYGSSPGSYENLEHDMFCYDNAGIYLSGPTECIGYRNTLGTNYRGTVHIACRDQPNQWNNFTLQINKTENFTLTGVHDISKNIQLNTPNTVILNGSPRRLSTNILEVNTSEVNINLLFDKQRICELASSVPGIVPADFPQATCSSFEPFGCNITLPARPDNAIEITGYPIACKTINQNTNEQLFSVEI